jgi:hypothetical protein
MTNEAKKYLTLLKQEYGFLKLDYAIVKCKKNTIKGNYVVTLDPLFLMGSGTQESTSFTIQLQDNAGNWSNTITTPVVLVVDSL